MASGKGQVPWTPAPLVNLRSTPVQIKTSPGGIGGYHLTNSDTAIAYVKVYDSVASPSVGTDIPVCVLGLPAGLGAVQAIGFAEIDFLHGIWVAATALGANSDTTNVTNNTIFGTIFYA